MQIPIKATSDGIGYASKSQYEWEGKQYEPDIQNGDVVAIKDEGTTETGQYGEQYYFKIDTRNGIKKAAFNQSSLNILAGAWGQDSTQWVGKSAKVLTRKAMIAGERRLVAYFVVDGWYVDEWGDLVKDEPIVPTGAQTATVAHKDSMPASFREAQAMEPGDIPFKD